MTHYHLIKHQLDPPRNETKYLFNDKTNIWTSLLGLCWIVQRDRIVRSKKFAYDNCKWGAFDTINDERTLQFNDIQVVHVIDVIDMLKWILTWNTSS